MKVGDGYRRARGAAVGLALILAAAGCASDTPDAPPGGGGPTTSAEPSPSPSRSVPPKVLIAKAFRRAQVAYKRKDARSAMHVLAPASVDYLKRLRRLTATGGPGQIGRLSAWEKLALTILRTDYDETLIGALSPEAFLDYTFAYRLNYFPAASLAPKHVKIKGPRTAVATVRGSRVRFTRVDDEWKVDVRGVYEVASTLTERIAGSDGVTLDLKILQIAEARARGLITPEVWQKP